MNFSIGFFMNKIEVTRPPLIPKFKIVFGNTLLKELEKTIKRRTTDTFLKKLKISRIFPKYVHFSEPCRDLAKIFFFKKNSFCPIYRVTLNIKMNKTGFSFKILCLI